MLNATYDAIAIGGGHNAFVVAATFASAGNLSDGPIRNLESGAQRA